MNIKALLRSFAGGEITPELYGRLDLTKYQTGLALARNFLVLPHGPVANRAGFEFVRAAKHDDKTVRLIPFSFNSEQTFVLEFGQQYIRFHTMGQTLMADGEPYEIGSPYAHVHLPELHFVQSADVLTLVHPEYMPAELRRTGASTWTFTSINFGPKQAAPTELAVPSTVAEGTDLDIEYTYAVTAVSDDGKEESALSTPVTVLNDLAQGSNRNNLAWAAQAGVVRFNVYRRSNGLYGFIGQAVGTTFTDANIAPDISKTPPEPTTPFVGAGNGPRAVSYFEQRRAFAGTTLKPQTFWLTRSATESNLSYSIPSRDDDAIIYRIAAREANVIRHIVSLSDLLLLTSGGVWRITANNGIALTPTTAAARQQSSVGASAVTPVVTDASVLYAQSRGGRLREVKYTWESQQYQSTDASIMAPHLFDGFRILDLSYARAPYQMLWAVSSSGKLLGLTYVPEHQVIAWHQHDTDGIFEAVATVSEGNEDVLYAVVRRTIAGVQRRYIERMRSRQFATPADAFFVDCGLTYNGAPATTFAGLSHLEGKTVAVLADGAVHPPVVVQSGAIALQQPASVVQVGLPITADLQTLPLSLEVQAAGQGNRKNVNEVDLRVRESSGIFAGPRFDALREHKARTDEPYGSAPRLQNGMVRIVTQPSWGDDAAVCVRQADPLPLTITSMVLRVAIGG